MVSNPITDLDSCCAHAASDKATTAPLRSMMNSRGFNLHQMSKL